MRNVGPADHPSAPDAKTVLAPLRHHAGVGVIRRKSFEDFDGLRELPLLKVSLARIGSHTIGRGVVQPGWRWSEHLAPVMQTASCPVHHVQVLLAGRFAVRMDDGEEVVFQPGDVMDVPPGHDAWVVGDEPVEPIDFAGNIEPPRPPPRARADGDDPAHDRYRRLDWCRRPPR
jgi:mannose-6-phosphate isomerase-like protein (cupin superfamily)